MWEQKKKQHYAGKIYTLGKAILSNSGRNFLLLVWALLGSVELCSCKTASAEARNCLHSAFELCGLTPSSGCSPGNGQNALQTNLFPGKSTSVDSQLEKFTSCFSKQEYITARGSPAFSLTKSMGVFSRRSVGVPLVLLKSPAMTQAGGGSEGSLAWQ